MSQNLSQENVPYIKLVKNASVLECPDIDEKTGLPLDPVNYESIPLERLIELNVNGVFQCYDVNTLKSIFERAKNQQQDNDKLNDAVEPFTRIPFPSSIKRYIKYYNNKPDNEVEIENFEYEEYKEELDQIEGVEFTEIEGQQQYQSKEGEKRFSEMLQDGLSKWQEDYPTIWIPKRLLLNENVNPALAAIETTKENLEEKIFEQQQFKNQDIELLDWLQYKRYIIIDKRYKDAKDLVERTLPNRYSDSSIKLLAILLAHLGYVVFNEDQEGLKEFLEEVGVDKKGTAAINYRPSKYQLEIYNDWYENDTHFRTVYKIKYDFDSLTYYILRNEQQYTFNGKIDFKFNDILLFILTKVIYNFDFQSDLKNMLLRNLPV